jgi:rubrerythrin
MVNTDNAVQSVLRSAIQREIDAHNLYDAAAKRTDNAQAKGLLAELALQEEGHRKRLESLMAGKTFKSLSRIQQRKVEDLKITDYLVEVPLEPDSDIQDILIVAGKREKASFELYSAMARVAADAETIKLFQFLAGEELQHKYRVESFYDDLVYKEN